MYLLSHIRWLSLKLPSLLLSDEHPLLLSGTAFLDTSGSGYLRYNIFLYLLFFIKADVFYTEIFGIDQVCIIQLMPDVMY